MPIIVIIGAINSRDVAIVTGNSAAPVLAKAAFGTFLLERDVCEPPIMFGAGGVLDTERFPFCSAPGLGITPRVDELNVLVKPR